MSLNPPFYDFRHNYLSFVPQLPKYMKGTTAIPASELFWRFHDIMHINCLANCPAHGRLSVSNAGFHCDHSPASWLKAHAGNMCTSSALGEAPGGGLTLRRWAGKEARCQWDPEGQPS